MAKGMYVGAGTEFPIYEERESTVTKSFAIGSSMPISSLFEVLHDDDYWFRTAGNGYSYWSNNDGVDDSSAGTMLTALYDMPTFSFIYDCSSEAEYDIFTIHLNNELIVETSGETSDTWSGNLSKGDTLRFCYYKDSGVSDGTDEAGFRELLGTYITTEIQKVQVGTEVVDVAREIIKQYRSVDGIARNIKKGYAEVNGVARQYFGGVAWEKYLCSMETGGYELHEYYSPGWSSVGSGYFYPDYEFSSDSGFIMKGTYIYRKADGSQGDPNDVIGMYWADRPYTPPIEFDNNGDVLLKVVGVVDHGIPMIEGDALWFAEEVEDVYSKFGTSYGTFYADEEALPEEGELIAGSPNADYCVLEVDGTLYYYEKQQ